jgi:hypothetical protein
MSQLDEVRVASSCDASWDNMIGDDRVRHCASCDEEVYNLSGMSRDDAEALLVAKGVDVCVRLYRRTGGTLITRDCGTRGRPWSRAAAALGLGALTLGASACVGKRAAPKPRIVAVFDDGDATLRESRAATLYVDGYEIPFGRPRFRYQRRTSRVARRQPAALNAWLRVARSKPRTRTRNTRRG